jgi:hypothetical protein
VAQGWRHRALRRALKREVAAKPAMQSTEGVKTLIISTILALWRRFRWIKFQ